MIGLIAVTSAGRAAAARLSAMWPDETRVYAAPARQCVPLAWNDCDALVCFLAAGATVRLVAPLLTDKRTDPAVVCVDEAGRHAVALLGGHGRDANALAVRVADALGAHPVVTTATDAAGVPGLDTLGWPVEGDVSGVTRAVLDGEPVDLVADRRWPLPALPPNVADADPGDGPVDLTRPRIVVSDRVLLDPGRLAGRRSAPAGTVVLRPPSLVVGVGSSRGASAAEIDRLVADALGDAGLSDASVACVATVDVKADEPGIQTFASQRGLAVELHPAARLRDVDVPNPSAAALAAVGTPSVAEAAALASAGPGAELVVTKRTSAMATAAVARRRPRGRLTVVGLGPGARDLMVPRAVAALHTASVVVGLDQYLDQVRDLLRPGTRVLASGLGQEEARAHQAVALAGQGYSVALVGSGDAGVYAMASPALEVAGVDIDVCGVPGVTANLAAAALLGAPLGHDHALISLSDLHTPWEAIERRVRGAAEGDFVVTFYNPRSRGRDWQLPKALGILAAHRAPSTPVGVVRSASRPGERVVITTLEDVDVSEVDMHSVVVVGSTHTRVVSGRIITPRGYRWLGP